jgi:hypothetical protein
MDGLTITKNKQLLPLPRRNLRQQRQQIERHPLGILAHNPARVCPRRIKVPQQRGIPLQPLLFLPCSLQIVPLRLDVVGDAHFDRKLRAAVRVGGAKGALFGDGHHVREAGRIAVDGRGAGEDDVGYVVGGHGAEEADGAVDVGVVVLEGDFGGLADGLWCAMSAGTRGFDPRYRRPGSASSAIVSEGAQIPLEVSAQRTFSAAK